MSTWNNMSMSPCCSDGYMVAASVHLKDPSYQRGCKVDTLAARSAYAKLQQ